MKTELTQHEKFKIYLISNNLDIELAEPAAIAPSLLNYPWDKLCIMLTILGKEFKNKNTTILTKPIYYNAIKFKATQENKYINEYLNQLFVTDCLDIIRRDIEYKVKHLAIKMEALSDS